jgi:hypothetical protein
LEDNYKSHYIHGILDHNQMSLSHLLDKEMMKDLPLMNTPPANGSKTGSKLHIGSTNHRGRGLFSCTPKNEQLNFGKDDGFRKLANNHA